MREWEIYVLQRLEYNMSMVTPMHCITYFNGRGVVFKGTATSTSRVVRCVRPTV